MMNVISRHLQVGIAFSVFGALVLAANPSTALAQIEPGVDPLAYERIYTGEPAWQEKPQHWRRHSWQHNRFAWWHGVRYQYQEGMNHGFPYGHNQYEPRFPGASYTFERWAPTRSYYYPYEPGHNGPYGYSPEPYYGPGY